MKINVGKPDKIARMVLGVLIIGLGVSFGLWWGLIGLVLLLTGFMSFCPIYLYWVSAPAKLAKPTNHDTATITGL